MRTFRPRPRIYFRPRRRIPARPRHRIRRALARIGAGGAFFLLQLGAVVEITAPKRTAAQSSDTVRVDSTHFARTYELRGITVSVVRPTLTTGGSSVVEARLDSLPALPAPTLEEVLRELPLLVVRRNSRGESQPALRGSEERQLGILVDGIPITIGWDHRSDLSIVPLTAARGVHVVRGMSSVLYGPNAIGGVIEVDVSRSARVMGSVKPFELSLSRDNAGGSGAAIGVGRLFGEAASGGSGGLALSAGAGFRDSPGAVLPANAASSSDLRDRYLAGPDGLRLNSDTRRLDAYFSARHQHEGGRWISLFTAGYDVQRGVVPEAHQDSPRLWRYPDQRRLVSAFSVGSGVVTTPWGIGDVEVSLGVDAGTTRIDAFATERYEEVTATEEARGRTLTGRIEADHSLTAHGDLRTAFTYADVRHDETLEPGGSFAYRQRLWSLAAETEWQLGRSGHTRISAGAALDGADTPKSGDKPALGALSTYGLRVGASSLVGSGVLVHGAASSRARFPSLRELYSGALGRFAPNPDLNPERLFGVEGGFTLHSGDLELQTVFFHQRLVDGIVRTSVQQGGMNLLKRVNREEVRSTGVEFLASGSVGVVAVSSDLTLQHVRGLERGESFELEYEPSTIGRVGVGLPVGAGVEASATTRWVGRQSCENPEIGGLQSVSASGIGDLALRRSFDGGDAFPGRLDAVLAFRNLTDATVFDQCGLPQPGRTLEVRLRFW